MKRPQGKRTRPIRGKYFLTFPHITHEGRILEVKVKLSQVIVTDLGPAKKRGRVGEIERGSVDGEESPPGAEEIAGRREPNTSDSSE